MSGKKSLQKYVMGKKESSYQRMLVSSYFYVLPSLIIGFPRFTPTSWIPSQKFPFSRLPWLVWLLDKVLPDSTGAGGLGAASLLRL